MITYPISRAEITCRQTMSLNNPCNDLQNETFTETPCDLKPNPNRFQYQKKENFLVSTTFPPKFGTAAVKTFGLKRIEFVEERVVPANICKNIRTKLQTRN